MTHHVETPKTFRTLPIAPKLLARIDTLGYTVPTPIQLDSIPPLINGRDLIGIAQTGTGKTLAFAVPVIQRIAQLRCTALVLLPTRELALQVNEVFEKIGKGVGLKTSVLIGGADISRQIKSLRTNPHVVIGTPGRIIDHLTRKSLRLSTVKMLVLDEADLMLDMGFAPQIKRILESVPTERQTMLFSATMPPAIQKIAENYMCDPLRVEVARSGTLADHIEQEVRYVSNDRKFTELETTLKENSGTAIVFVRTKHSAKKVSYALRSNGFSATEIHSNRSLAQRRAALDGFKSGKHKVLVATDIAARGIDVSGIGRVINFDLPESPEDYVHRIGRTGRAGKSGQAISFATPSQRQLVRRIEKLTGSVIDPSLADYPVERTAHTRPYKKFQRHSRASGFSRAVRKPNFRYSRARA